MERQISFRTNSKCGKKTFEVWRSKYIVISDQRTTWLKLLCCAWVRQSGKACCLDACCYVYTRSRVPWSGYVVHDLLFRPCYNIMQVKYWLNDYDLRYGKCRMEQHFHEHFKSTNISSLGTLCGVCFQNLCYKHKLVYKDVVRRC